MMEERAQTLNERQVEMLSTCMESCQNVAYPFMALIEEVGELAEKVRASLEWRECIDNEEKDEIEFLFDELIKQTKYFRTYAKAIRHGAITPPFDLSRNHEDRVEIAFEIGDVDWDLHVFANNIGFSSQEIADWNHEKLAKRKKRNEIDGNGDHERTAIENSKPEQP